MHRPVMDPDHPEYSNDDPTVARAQELAHVEAEIQMISAERDAMSQDNGFVERPVVTRGRRSSETVIGRLRRTADNGKAIRVTDRSAVTGNYHKTLKRQGLQLRTAKQLDGTYLAWCERIDAARASRPEGARP